MFKVLNFIFQAAAIANLLIVQVVRKLLLEWKSEVVATGVLKDRQDPEMAMSDRRSDLITLRLILDALQTVALVLPLVWGQSETIFSSV